MTNLAGTLLGTALTYLGWRRAPPTQRQHNESDERPATLKQLARRHIDFPLLRTPQNLINAFSQSLPILLLSTYFGASSAGHYTIAISVLGIPSNLIGGAVMSVFYPRITAALNNGENARALIIKATVGMAAAGAIPFLIVMLGGPFLFSFIFGKEWHIAGHYAQWLAAWLFVAFINRPAVSAIPALRLQGFLLSNEIISIMLRVVSLYVGFALLRDNVAAVMLFSIVGVLINIHLIYYVIRHSNE
ncbi:MAG: oligosaccharide flippase family protein [Gammaproteobacteria bacterium]|nr:oligosaccharide flippase family protein [Gammaproteobacteria bacterium]